jgi:hypothetical protein
MCLSPDGTKIYVISGHKQKIAEYSIPSLSKNTDHRLLNEAALTQPFTFPFGTKTLPDLLNGSPSSGQLDYEITSLYASGADLVVSGFYYYDGTGAQKYQVIKRPADLSQSGPVISTQVGDNSTVRYWTGGIEPIPNSFRTAHSLPSHAIGRFGGSIDDSLSLGPVLGAFDLSALADKATIPITKMLAYPLVKGTTDRDHALSKLYGYHDSYSTQTDNYQNKWYTSGHTVHAGTVWLHTRPVVLFIGYIGIGTPWYDKGSGAHTDTAFPSYAIEDKMMAHGNHCAPYLQYMWAYEESELAAVLAGTKQTWEAKPYDVWQLPETPYSQKIGDQPWIGGVAHDSVNRKIYVMQPKKDKIGDFVQWPVIDVYTYPA